MKALGILLLVAPALRAADGGVELAPKEWRIDVVGGAPQSARTLHVTVPPEGLNGLRVSSTPLTEKDRAIEPNGELCVSIGKLDAGFPCSLEAGPAEVAAGTPGVNVYLEPRGLDPAGDYRAELRVGASAFDGTSRSSLRIVVTDGWQLPALVIFLGVALGALVHFLAGRYRSKQQLALRLQRIRNAVNAWRRDPSPLRLLDEIEQDLADAETRNTAYQLTDKDVTALEAKVDQYRKMLQEREAAKAQAQGVKSMAAKLAALLPRTPAARLNAAELLIALISVAVATCTGLLALYTPPFGRLDQYLGAFLWGLGIDSSVRGFRAVFQKLDSP